MVEICTTTAQEQLSEIGAGAISGCFADNVLLGTDPKQLVYILWLGIDDFCCGFVFLTWDIKMEGNVYVFILLIINDPNGR